MAQGAFGTQLFEQLFGTLKVFGRAVAAFEQQTKTTLYLGFGEQDNLRLIDVRVQKLVRDGIYFIANAVHRKRSFRDSLAMGEKIATYALLRFALTRFVGRR